MIPIIGGKLDGQESPLSVVSFDEKGEQYILCCFKEKKDNATITHRFYVLCNGPTVAEAQKVYRERRGLK